MKGLVSMIAIAVLSLVLSAPAQAAAPSSAGVHHHHHHWQPKKAHYGKRMRAHQGAHCKMSGSC
jgi:hypothetical protein